MRPRLWKVGIFILVMAVVLAGVTSCERQAQSREANATEPAQVSGTGEAPSGSNATPAQVETIVSAVTPPPQATASGGQTQPTSAPASETPAAAEPTATTAAGAATEEQAAQPTASTTQPGETVWHTVQPGETLSSIAARYGTTWQAIANANNLSNPNQIYVGQKLEIPTSQSPTGASTSSGCRIRHTVKSGEWVWQIARNYGVSPYDILAANGLTIQTANTIYAGQVLCIP
jgi:LysM repeat protein